MKYLRNSDNLVRTATLSATNIVPSTAIFRTDSAPKIGRGRVAVTGPFTGQSDATIDVEVTDLIGDSSRVSQPVFTGIGNGQVSSLAASDIAVQDFVISLEDAGTDTRAATAPFMGVTLRAKETGDDGNLISLRVSHANLVLTGSEYALQQDVRAGTNEYVGDEFYFHELTSTIRGDGSFPPNAPRVVMGSDPQVYRAFRKYRDGRYVYAFSPAPTRDIPRGTRIYAVSGSRTVTISDDVTTETLPNIVTLYDALSAIRDTSDLVQVEGPIINDLLPGGQGAVDLSVWTSSYVLGVTTDGGDSIKHADLRVSATESAPTELLTFTCKDATATGSEVWEVRGDVSGRLSDAITAVLYSDGAYETRIPPPEFVEAGDEVGNGQIMVELRLGSGHANATRVPSLCVVRPRLGAAAVNGRYVYTYAARPPEECDCSTGNMNGGPNDDCLGTTEPGGGPVTDASVKLRLQRIANARATLIEGNTSPINSVSADDVAWINNSAAELAAGVRALTSAPAATLWAAETEFKADVQIDAGNGYRYVSSGGVSGGTAPTWPTSLDATVSDGTIIWTNIGKTAMPLWDEAFTQWKAEAAMIAGMGPSASAEEWTSDKICNVGDFLVPSAQNGCVYRAFSSLQVGGATSTATHGTTEPIWPTDVSGSPSGRQTVASTFDPAMSTVWVFAWRYWSARQSIAMGTVARPGNGRAYRVTTAGITGTSEPTWPTSAAGTVTDGAAVWTEFAAHDIATQTDPVFFERYRSRMSAVAAAAGIDPNFDSAGPNGDGCWQDHGGTHWFVFTGDEPFLPIQPGYYHHESILRLDANGNNVPMTTRRWGFGPKFGCEELLQDGDQLVITVSGVQGSGTGGRGYQQGDRFSVRINHALPVPFGGGQTGTDTLTWSVVGSTAGRLADYVYLKNAPAPYAGTVGVSGELAFLLTPGGIPFALGDTFRFSIEGGHVKYRVNGGAYTEDVDIGSIALSDGLTIAMTGGVAPSWAVGDAWSFRAEATHGADALRQPTDGRTSWTGSTVISVGASGTIDGVMIADHAIPSDATITLQGSDDDFATTPTSVAIPWRAGNIWHPVTATRAKWRITINKSGSIQWLWMSQSYEPPIKGDVVGELGRLTKRFRLPGIAARRALGVEVEHSGLSSNAVDDVLAMLMHACDNDDRRIGIVANEDAAIVEYESDSLEVSELQGFQPAKRGDRLHTINMTLSPV